jgi:hypothetical protein
MMVKPQIILAGGHVEKEWEGKSNVCAGPPRAVETEFHARNKMWWSLLLCKAW